MGRALGVAQSRIYSWITGSTKPSFEALVTICTVCKVSPNWQIGGEETIPKELDQVTPDVTGWMKSIESRIKALEAERVSRSDQDEETP
jgi:transcriptional regulator with XRE-family HTH domain